MYKYIFKVKSILCIFESVNNHWLSSDIFYTGSEKKESFIDFLDFFEFHYEFTDYVY